MKKFIAIRQIKNILDEIEAEMIKQPNRKLTEEMCRYIARSYPLLTIEDISEALDVKRSDCIKKWGQYRLKYATNYEVYKGYAAGGRIEAFDDLMQRRKQFIEQLKTGKKAPQPVEVTPTPTKPQALFLRHRSQREIEGKLHV
ncbi:hypothetical protein BGC07_15480 [Piscirickettsia litoralis]|uniref:Uncharacterized protein n=2 Tax=Piscirickettsia litoralis TaxID=1891921 RepID=A0ABX2ZZ49_9GAMM|nr:hypothetical protein BGC07_15480 [Piscirickettsia litoralis]